MMIVAGMAVGLVAEGSGFRPGAFEELTAAEPSAWNLDAAAESSLSPTLNPQP